MVVATVKEQNSKDGTLTGWLVNGNINVPNHASNSDYHSVQAFIADGGLVSPMYIDAEILDNAKTKKIAEIDASTKVAIITKAGDETKQRNQLMLGELLLRKESKGTATLNESAMLDAMETMALEVATLRDTGNAREASVGSIIVDTNTTLAQALVAIEGI